MSFRTDLAHEALEHCQQTSHHATHATQHHLGFAVTSTHIASAEDAQILGKPQGHYHTVSMAPLHQHVEHAFAHACTVVSGVLQTLLPSQPRCALVIGLGNRNITADAIGPASMDHVLATRHLIDQVPDHFADWHAVCALATGVLGQTGLEVGEIAQGLVDTLAPDVVIVVDALACGRLSHLLHTIQLTDTGIVPGSGVGNARAALNRDTLGVPVIAIGVPTVVDGATLAHEITRQLPDTCCEALDDLALPTIITTRDIDQQVVAVSKVIGYAINLALHPQLSLDDVQSLLQ